MTTRILTSLILAALAMLGAGAPALAQDDPLVARGRAAFMANGCHGCHTVGRMGTPIGPDLSHVGFKYRSEYIERWLRDPSYLRPSAHMPKLEIAEKDVKALAAFLAAQR